MGLIERKSIEHDHGLAGTLAIVDHPKHDRVLMVDGFGGTDTLAGGAVRWRHGAVYKLRHGDTLAMLEGANFNDNLTCLDAILASADKTRPLISGKWGGFIIENMAKSVGL